MLLATPSLSWVPIVPPQRAAFVPARSSTPTPSQPTYVRPNFSPPLSPAPPLHAYSFSFCRARQFFLHHPLFLRCAVVRSSPVGVLVSLLSPSLPHHCATCSDLRIPISHICTLFLPLSGISEYFSGLVYAFFARTRLYTQNRLSVSLSFASSCRATTARISFSFESFPFPYHPPLSLRSSSS